MKKAFIYLPVACDPISLWASLIDILRSIYYSVMMILSSMKKLLNNNIFSSDELMNNCTFGEINVENQIRALLIVFSLDCGSGIMYFVSRDVLILQRILSF